MPSASASLAPTRRATGVLAALAGAIAVVLAFAAPAPAFAHDELLSQTPADGATLAELPAELELTFSAEPLAQEGGTAVVVTDASGADLTDGEPVVDGTIVRQALTTDASIQGDITIQWRVVSSDGHPISGLSGFTVQDAPGQSADPQPSASGEPEADETPLVGPDPAATPTDDPVERADDRSWPTTVVYGTLLAIAGAVVVAMIVWLVVRRIRTRRSDS